MKNKVNDPRCEWVVLIDQDDDRGIIQHPCGEPAAFGATIAPQRYAIWLCDAHLDEWVRVERMKRAG